MDITRNCISWHMLIGDITNDLSQRIVIDKSMSEQWIEKTQLNRQFPIQHANLVIWHYVLDEGFE